MAVLLRPRDYLMYISFILNEEASVQLRRDMEQHFSVGHKQSQPDYPSTVSKALVTIVCMLQKCLALLRVNLV